ncbi:hypothetical protein [Shewanella hafniensis]|uniref:hypothetical protein n=1 Tax=Shewanella hafniensis TaxID=365590 RepID=UPI00200DF85C|nr:hypothetical protein [Shewanella hafniensis]MCL1136932.1 hypothetical protein [Shewanella hafniensis]
MLNKETEDLGLEIDIAFDNNDISKLEVLLVSCDSLMENETSENYSVLYFYKANCYAALRMIERKDVDDTWSWHQERLVAEILNLRKALAEPGFEKLHEIIQCKILTNIANGMSSLGRVIESISYYEEALSRIDNFAMALGNKAIGQVHYGQHLYDHGHSGIFFFHANKELNRFGSEPLLWDCGIQQDALDTFMGYRDFTEDVLEDIEFDSKFDFNNFSLGKHQKEQDYRRWCPPVSGLLSPLNNHYV